MNEKAIEAVLDALTAVNAKIEPRAWAMGINVLRERMSSYESVWSFPERRLRIAQDNVCGSKVLEGIVDNKAVEAAVKAFEDTSGICDYAAIRAAISAYLDAVATREGVAEIIRDNCVLSRADIAQGIDGADDAASAVLTLLRGEVG